MDQESRSTAPAGKNPRSLAFSCYHLAEAIGELSNLLTAVSLGVEVTDDNNRLATRLAHTYQHVNWFWNGRNRIDADGVDLTDEEFYRFSAFPTELEALMARGSAPVDNSEQ